LVKVYVGPEKALWFLPEHLLCDRVPFFRSAFQGGFRESKERVLELPEDDPIAFAFIVDRVFSEWRIGSKLAKDQEGYQLIWCKIYVLADKLGRSDIACSAEQGYMWHIRSRRDRCINEGLDLPIVDPAAAKFLYENTTDSATMRKTLAQTASDLHFTSPCMSAPTMERWVESASCHPEFLFDIIVSIRKLVFNNPKDHVCSMVSTSCTVHKPNPNSEVIV
jgi:hypothetical protein